MITNIETKDVWDKEGTTWMRIITWQFNGIANRVEVGTAASIDIIKQLVSMQIPRQHQVIKYIKGK